MVFEVVLSGADIVLADNLDKVGPGSLHILEFRVVLGSFGLVERQCRRRFGVSWPICTKPV
jgi:hypothetical protein